MFGQGRQYRTVAGYRSALSMSLPAVEGVPVGQHGVIRRVVKGMFHRRPPMPRYTVTWDVAVVLEHLRQAGSNASLSLRLLTLKTCMLLALASPRRQSELSRLELSRMARSTDEVVFTLPGLAKGQRQGQPARRYTYPVHPTEPALCPVAALDAYVQATAGHRGGQQRVFLSYRRPHRPVTASTVARWLVTVLGAAGVDTDCFRAHSTRSAATSAAARGGASVNDILEAGDWASARTFRRFYHRELSPLPARPVAASVLSTDT